MATAATGTGEPRESREHERTGKQIVIVDLDEAQSSQQVRRLRRGKGKLVHRVERIISDLIEAGTIKATAQPVVLVVREFPSLRPLEDEEEDEDDDD